jgi:hypothetical protein
MQLQQRERQTSTSTSPEGERALWNMIWKANVPPKIKTFGWKLASNTLGVQVQRCRRNMEVLPTCTLCGMEPESSHHAMVSCIKARALRYHMSETWDLPPEHYFRYTGEDWVLILLNQCSDDMKAKLLFLWWRAWHLRNNSIFGDGKCSVEQSATYIQSYLSMFMQIKDPELGQDYKGKKPMVTMGDGLPKQRNHRGSGQDLKKDGIN